MISYAQNFEDVILWRVLKYVKCGFYIDVGANDPIIDSVTKWFYCNGWTGINCEPSESFYQKLCQDRPCDINICSGIGDVQGEKTFYEIENTGLSTTDKKIAEKHFKAGFKIKNHTIKINTLTDVCRKYAIEKDIHFLKIDVEGAEGEVLKGLDFKTYRPWILIIEATIPNSQELDIGWENYVIAQDYEFVYFDGLSRFYISREKVQELKNKFILPPNVFDNFIKYNEVELQRINGSLQQEKAILQQKNEMIQQEKKVLQQNRDSLQQGNEILQQALDSFRQENKVLQQDRDTLQQQSNRLILENTSQINELKNNISNLNNIIIDLQNSWSWKLTKPLRKLKSLFIH